MQPTTELFTCLALSFVLALHSNIVYTSKSCENDLIKSKFHRLVYCVPRQGPDVVIRAANNRAAAQLLT